MNTQIALCTVIMLCNLMNSQNIIEPEKPQETEIWTPELKEVTPKDSDTQYPSDALVLFDGTNFDQWESSKKDQDQVLWLLDKKEKSMTVKRQSGDIQTKKKFGSVQFHIEWRSPHKIEGEGQNRGNSGIFFQERYEIQVLDNYQNKTYINGQAGSIYKQSSPLVNACKKPGEWQTYDIIFHAPKFDDFGQVSQKGSFTVLHNGILIQDHQIIKGTTEYIGWPKNKPHGKGSIKLQDHGCDVSYRNIWVRELKD